jgi:hypothetical protein
MSESVAGVPGWLAIPLTLARIISLARCRAERSVIITIQLANGETVPVKFWLTVEPSVKAFLRLTAFLAFFPIFISE